MIRIRGFSNEVCAAVVDRVVVHGRTMRESGLRAVSVFHRLSGLSGMKTGTILWS